MARESIKEPEDGIFTTFKKIITLVFFPQKILNSKWEDLKDNDALSKLTKYTNTVFRFLLIICVMPAIPFIIVFVIMLESMRYFFSKFIHL